MKKSLLLLSSALMGMSAMAASEVTLVSVEPGTETTITSHDQAFVVTFSGAVTLDAENSGIYCDYYGYGEDYLVQAPTVMTPNDDNTVWTLSLSAADTYVTYQSTNLWLQLVGTDAQGEQLAGPNDIITGIDYSSYSYITSPGWLYKYAYSVEKPVYGLSSVTVLGIDPVEGTHIGSNSQQFVVTFSDAVNLETSNSGIYYRNDNGGLSRITSLCQASADGTQWTLSADPDSYYISYLDEADSVFVRFRGADLNGDTLCVGATHYHNEYEDWYGDLVVDDYYYYQSGYPYGTAYSLGFSPVDEDGEQYAKVSQLDQFSIIIPEGAVLNSACAEAIEVYSYVSYDNVATFTAADAQVDGTTVTFTLAEPCTEGGNYRVYVPAGFFTMPDSYDSRPLYGYIYVKGIKYTWKPSSLNPAAGNVTNLETIDLAFSDYTEYNPETAHAVLLDAEGNVASEITWGYKGNDGLGIILTLDQSIEGKFGRYSLVIDQASFGNQTWVDEEYLHDGKANPELRYEYVLYDENNVTLSQTLPCTALFALDYDWNTGYTFDSIETHMEFYDNGTCTIKKFAGVNKYDISFRKSDGYITAGTDYTVEDNTTWTSGYIFNVATGRADYPKMEVEFQGWYDYNFYTLDSYYLDHYGYPEGTQCMYWYNVSIIDPDGQSSYSFYNVLIWPEDEEQSIQTVRRDGSEVVRYYTLDGKPAKADAKGLLIMVRNGESSRVFKM